jgi:D-alanine-D-alanine ligase
MRIGVTFDLRADYLAMGMSEEESAEFDSEITIASLCEALAGLGHEPVRIGHIRSLTQRLVAGERWDAVFNICEGLTGYAREAQVPALLEAYQIPAVFSDPLTLALTLDKSWTKRIVRSEGVPTPDFAVIESVADADKVNLPFPLFLKPVAEGSGKGVSERSRVNNQDGLRATAAALLSQFRQPVLVETYLAGREFTVGITGTGKDASVLGVMEIKPTAKGTQSGYSYENKEHWEDRVTLHMANDAEAAAAAEVALAGWRALRCRDGGRVDVRSDGQGRPHFLEVNPLAGLNPEHSDLCFIARFQGLSYQELIGLIVTSFLKRHPELARARAAA